MRFNFIKLIFANSLLLLSFLSFAGSQVGQPVRCFFSGAVPPSETKDFICINVAGNPSFIDGKVPSGHFLLVTDIGVTPDAGTLLTGLTDIAVQIRSSSNSILTRMRLRNTNTNTIHRHFKIPHLILAEGLRLDVTNAHFSDFSAEVSITGLLVTQLEMPIYFSGFDLVPFNN